jgi:hypothetical protein
MFHSRSTIVFISLTPQHDGFGQHARSCPLQKFRKLCSPCPSPPSIPSARVGALPSSPVTSRHLPRGMPCPSCDRGTILRGTQPSKQESTHAHPSRILYIATTLLSLHSNVGKGNLGTLLFFFCCRRNLSSVGREGGREGPLCSSSYFTCNCKRRSKGGLG